MYKASRAAALVLALAGAAAAQPVREYELKAAFLYNFTRFVEWPGPPASAPFCIGVDGDDPFSGALDSVLRGRTAGDRAIVARRFKAPAAAAGCEIVFIPGLDLNRSRAVLDSVRGRPVLTVGEAPGFCRSGGVIEFSVEESKVRLTINLDAAQRAHLQISSKLLSLASIARDQGPGSGER